MALPSFPPRRVTVLLSDRAGGLLGSLPGFETPVPWWQEASQVVDGCRERYGLDVAVLRVLPRGDEKAAAGGPVTYLAELLAGDPTAVASPWEGPTPSADHPLRLPYARPGGPAAEVAWADARLEDVGRQRTGPAVQIRTWNLSSIFRLPTTQGDAWLKSVPPFFAHEGAMLQRLDPELVPPLIAAESPRVLLEGIAGEDHWGAPLPVLLRVLETLVGLQADWVSRVDELEEVGAPDWRPTAFVPAVERLVDRTASEVDEELRPSLDRLVTELADRLLEVGACRVPDTFVHGDFHPGNTRGSTDPGGRSVLLDWGDCGIGNPLLDQAAFLASVAEEQREPLRQRWAELWRSAAPSSDPVRAAALLTPVAALRQALIYQVFLDGIEPDERVYHAGDPRHWLTVAARAAADGR